MSGCHWLHIHLYDVERKSWWFDGIGELLAAACPPIVYRKGLKLLMSVRQLRE